MLERASFGLLLSLAACTSASSNDTSASVDEVKTTPTHVRTVTTTTGADAIKRNADTIFYTDFLAAEVRSVPVAGGASKVLWKGRLQPQDQLGDIAIDDTDVYFVEDGQIIRVPQGGGRWEIVIRNSTDFPGDIDLDDTYVYWTLGWSDHALIKRVAKTGGTPEVVYDGPRGGNGIAVRDGFVYFYGSDRTAPEGDHTQWLMKVEAKKNGAVTEVAKMDTGAREIVMAGDEIFFASKSGAPASWGIRAVSKDGGAVRTVAELGESNDVQPYSLTATGNQLYWSQSMTFDWHQSPPGQHDAKVLSIPMRGATAPTEIATKLESTAMLATTEGACPVWAGKSEILTIDSCR